MCVSWSKSCLRIHLHLLKLLVYIVSKGILCQRFRFNSLPSCTCLGFFVVVFNQNPFFTGVNERFHIRVYIFLCESENNEKCIIKLLFCNNMWRRTCYSSIRRKSLEKSSLSPLFFFFNWYFCSCSKTDSGLWLIYILHLAELFYAV